MKRASQQFQVLEAPGSRLDVGSRIYIYIYIYVYIYIYIYVYIFVSRCRCRHLMPVPGLLGIEAPEPRQAVQDLGAVLRQLGPPQDWRDFLGSRGRRSLGCTQARGERG